MVLLQVDAVLTGADNVDMIKKLSKFHVRAMMTHVSCVDAADTDIQDLRQGLS